MRRWQVATLTRIDVVRLTWLLWGLGVVRGLDYGTGADTAIAAGTPAPAFVGHAPVSALVGIEAAFPLWIWSILILTSSGLLLVGLVRRWHSWVWVGHVALSALYLALSLGLAYGYLDRPAFDGIRTATGLLFPASLHALLWWRMGPVPITTPGDAGE